MKCHILFSGKTKKNISKCCLLKILSRVLSSKVVTRVDITVDARVDNRVDARVGISTQTKEQTETCMPKSIMLTRQKSWVHNHVRTKES